MNIKALGSLTIHPDVDEWLVSKPIPVPYFDGLALPFTLVGFQSTDEASVEALVDAFLALTARDRQAAATSVYQNYRELKAIYDDGIDYGIESEDNVWDFVRPAAIFLHAAHHNPYEYDAPHVSILAECDWDDEHGLELAYRNGNELSKVSGQG